MPASRKALKRWAMLALGAQFAALIRILAEYFRLRALHGNQLNLLRVDPWIEAALLTSALIVAATFPIFFERYKLTIALGVVTVLALLLFKWYLISTGALPGWL